MTLKNLTQFLFTLYRKQIMDRALKSCDTFVVLPPNTKKNLTIFGKNSDRPNGEVQEIVYYPRRTYETGTKVEASLSILTSHQNQ